MKSDAEEIAEFLRNWDDFPSKLLNNAIEPISLKTEFFGKGTFFYYALLLRCSV